MEDGPRHVSVTGLRLRRRRDAARFWWHAIRSMRQAQTAEGNLRAEARTIDGVHHTLTTWESRAAMRRYVAAPPHRDALRIFDEIATGSVVGFTSDREPTWEEALVRWERDGRVVARRRRVGDEPAGRS